MDFSAQINEKRPPITVDGDGGSLPLSAGHPGLTLLLVGTIGHQEETTAGIRSDDTVGIVPPAPLFVQGETEHEATNRMESTGFRPPLRQENPERTRTTVGGDNGGASGSSEGLRRNKSDYRSRDGVSLLSRFTSDSYFQTPLSPGTISSSQVYLSLSSTLPRDLAVHHSRSLEPNIGQGVASRKFAGLRRVRDATELRHITIKPRTDRRMDGNGIYLSVRTLTSTSVCGALPGLSARLTDHTVRNCTPCDN